MILLDTSAIYALADSADANHNRAVALFGQALENGEEFLVHNGILVEAAALLQHRLGLTAALRFLRDADSFQVHWTSAEDHRRALALLEERGRRGLSLVDCMSFVVMRQHEMQRALAFDSDFEQEGFTAYSLAAG